MTSFFSSRRSAPTTNSDLAGQAYEQDQSRLIQSNARSTGVVGPNGRASNPRDRYIGSFAPNPAFIRLLRFFLYTITSLSALATAGVGISVVAYYNSHQPAIRPSWGSLVAVIVFGIITPGILFGLFIVTPRLFRHGGVGGILNQTRIELLMLFSLAAIWISGALALACDLRGRENCIWDGFYHYPKPADFDDVCRLINTSVALAYTTFGLCAIQMVVFWTAIIYILLYLDQEVLTEPTNDAGGRAYRARTLALAQHQDRLNARNAAVSTSGPEMVQTGGAGPMSGGFRSPGAATGAGVGRSGVRRASTERYRDEEEGDRPEPVGTVLNHGAGSGYYGYETNQTHV